jgi:CBS domain-containing protein
MQVRQAMSGDVQCCTAETPIPEVARMMVSGDCGAIPVVDDGRRPVGVVTDRDITLRTVAKGQDPRGMKAGDCMSQPVVSVRAGADLREAVRVMERRQVRRVPVIDEKGVCCGMLAQADVARMGGEHEAAELVKDVSRPREGRGIEH